MSTNIHIIASRSVMVVESGKVCKQHIKFETYQTPTVVTRKIMDASDKVGAYKDWVMSISENEDVNVYSSYDILEEGSPIGTEVYNAGKDHLTRLDMWIEGAVKDCYNIEFLAY